MIIQKQSDGSPKSKLVRMELTANDDLSNVPHLYEASSVSSIFGAR